MPNLVPAARLPEHLVANARLLPDRDAILPLLPKHKVFAEVGVALGGFSDQIIRVCEPERFIAIDLFDLHRMPEFWGQPTKQLFSGDTHGEFYRKRFADLIAHGRITVLPGDSKMVLAKLDDASIDIIYVDAEHTYEAVKSELAVIRRKIKDDGYIIMNDYIMNEAGLSNGAYGVIQATNEFMIAENWELIYFAFQSYMYCDVVLRKASSAPVAMPDPRSTALMRQIVELETRNTSLEQTPHGG
jgi:hypothetical protein